MTSLQKEHEQVKLKINMMYAKLLEKVKTQHDQILDDMTAIKKRNKKLDEL